jgi:uncharacterized damage-inducible protein DinB
MNQLMSQMGGLLQSTQGMRNQMMLLLTDADLAYRLPGDNLSLGELCREIGEVEQAYIDSFRTRQHNFGYKTDQQGLEGSVERLNAWYAALDAELLDALNALTQEDVERGTVDRGGGFHMPISAQFHTYREALLIFYAKASLYLRALRKPLPHQIAEWIG